MINPFDYLYYKIYNALSYINGGIPANRTLGLYGLIIALNVLSIIILIVGDLPDIYIVISLIFVFLFVFAYFRKKKENAIIKRYENETENSRIIGNVSVIIYVLLSIVSFVWAIKHIASN